MNKPSQVRYLQSLGENMQKIVKHLIKNQTLMRYLYYTDQDPLSSDKPNVTFEDVYGKQVRIIPVVDHKDDSTSIISINVLKGIPLRDNSEFRQIFFNVEIFVPTSQWILKSDNLRPYLILGEIEKSLSGIEINGLGKISSTSFSVNFFTEKMSAYEMNFSIMQYD